MLDFTAKSDLQIDFQTPPPIIYSQNCCFTNRYLPNSALFFAAPYPGFTFFFVPVNAVSFIFFLNSNPFSPSNSYPSSPDKCP